ncbi:CBS domain-containing protein [Lactiplantibacillus garii]|uniref:CBS domain-containing protein n=1 Tax=Lactiplantibacillus garii TaxID=2306423 RepID=A0A426D7L5_9LACO|nr:CBS domain-containing protein [Lactiplantibacillus garii]RRK10584.1 CBS domain-containing protein [Lactiplantibacillus garii]
MSVADYMTDQLVVVRPETTVSVAVELMRTNDIHRLPVMDNNRMVGLITHGIVERALPSPATSLSVYETNYLLTKTTVDQIMETNVQTVAANAQLEDAIYAMRKHQIGVLPVMDGEQVVGIITNNDILDAFLNISDYGEPGVVTRVVVHHDHVGVIFKIGQVLAAHDLSIQTLMVVNHQTTKVIEIHVASDQVNTVNQVLTAAGFEIQAI